METTPLPLGRRAQLLRLRPLYQRVDVLPFAATAFALLVLALREHEALGSQDAAEAPTTGAAHADVPGGPAASRSEAAPVQTGDADTSPSSDLAAASNPKEEAFPWILQTPTAAATACTGGAGTGVATHVFVAAGAEEKDDFLVPIELLQLQQAALATKGTACTAGPPKTGEPETSVADALIRYGRNVYDIPVPPYQQLLMQQLLSPFFCFQVFCVSLWLLDGYWSFPLSTLILLVVVEAQTALKHKRELMRVRDMQRKPPPVYVHRKHCSSGSSGSSGKCTWRLVDSSELLPGDIFCWEVHAGRVGGLLAPADALLLQGTAVVDESLLTGEAIPQAKAGLSLTAADPEALNEALELQGRHKQFAVFAGKFLSPLLPSPPWEARGDAFSAASWKIQNTHTHA
ncbi:P-type ATPase related protein [Cyclospora cayetanensis]|uniref:P-type ATPase related protein n=1 Tax=Cyclospora cayetanensis TaxID=88456 RepID=A0A1D3CZU4_9EIME|nr:P-type ATPase related protein [Cyclospora cayetanensis]